MTVEWRPVPGHPAYEVSSMGEVRTVGGEPVQLVKGARGRRLWYFVASDDKRSKHTSSRWASLARNRATVSVATAVLEAFVGRPAYTCEACHKDGNVMDNRLDNLLWMTLHEYKKRMASK